MSTYVPICSSFRTPKRFPWHASLGLEIHLRCTVLQALLWPESAGATASTSRSVDQRERLIARASTAIVPISGWCFTPTEFSIVAKQRTDDLWANEHKVYATFSVSLHKRPCIRLEIRSFVEWIHWFWLIKRRGCSFIRIFSFEHAVNIRNELLRLYGAITLG